MARADRVVVLDEENMRLASLAGDPYAEAILRSVRVEKPKEKGDDHSRNR